MSSPDSSTRLSPTESVPTQVIPSPVPSLSDTVIGLNGAPEKHDKTSLPVEEPLNQQKVEAERPMKLSQRKKWSLLAVFSLGFFVDVWSYSAFFIFTGPISESLDILFEQQTWVITSYAVTFAAFLLLWGRVSDLWSAKPVFSYGFIVLGILDLIISFLPDKYSFFVLRAISGIAGATLIPASFRLIVAVFEPHELGKAFTLYGMSGALANTTGIIIAGFVEYIPNGGQGEAWRWFFRILAILIMPFAIGSLYFIPTPKGAIAQADDKWKRLDIVGTFSMLAGIVLLILGLTLGASYGWKKAGFLAPFLIAWVLIVFFFFWEARLSDECAILPSKTWRIPNFAVLITLGLFIYGWWSVNFLPFVEIFVRVHNERAIIAAVRMLPQGIAAGVVTVVLTLYPKLTSNPRWPISVGLIGGAIGLILFTQSEGDVVGSGYWRWVFTGGAIGSSGVMIAFTGTNVGVMTSVPPEMAGVAGAVLQVSLQVGSAVALSIQSGLLTINPGNLENFSNVKASWYFELGWTLLWLVGFLVFYRPGKRPVSSAEDGAEQGERPIMAH
ncbi:Predicted transporter (major facilitator superfamily) [Phaffia rhodozyma]|uniref:Predicted transporter (Major facilitator superfamily) n=1 Tax=Phaffia rhodozyma TaxID=264483 RepID=A0A0F7SJT8_PHARH|nr:Predicted transporter (major facilitator superfamily) [Phaffia rhodozyma]